MVCLNGGSVAKEVPHLKTDQHVIIGYAKAIQAFPFGRAIYFIQSADGFAVSQDSECAVKIFDLLRISSSPFTRYNIIAKEVHLVRSPFHGQANDRGAHFSHRKAFVENTNINHLIHIHTGDALYKIHPAIKLDVEISP